ncbi:hypothetical protein IMSAGC014_01512 [Bacteroidaceae bacterium]|uniref:BatD family protein n=1 Tax=Prevotella sp. MGM2 TaxID=2033406 RepID=UPI000CEA4AF2|nr:BatD family protein [Prevotella sp. MGM2]GFI35004.1 hypothetical protein IMSAGC014_01512 [Bacteroidaceae bacterium]
MSYIRYVLLLLILGCTTSQAQLRLEVEAPSKVDINETYFHITYTIASASTHDFSKPPMTGLDVLAGPAMSVNTVSSTVMSGGRSVNRSSSSTTFTFTLAPLEKGTFTIPAASVKVDGKTYKSPPVTIQVTGNGNRQNAGNQQQASSQDTPLRTAGSRVTDKDLYIRAIVGREQVYEQEAVSLSYKFYERPGVGLNSVSLSKKPDFKGMVSLDIPLKNIDAAVERVGGEMYRTGVVQQYVVFPQQTGRITIPGLTFNCVVLQQEAGLSLIDAFFNGGGNIGYSLTRNVPETFIEVKPLPQPRPSGFSGGVGQFSVRGDLLTETPRTNDMVTYRLTVSGSGNLQLLTAPSITFPADFDVYSPKVTDNTKVLAGGVTGDIIFDYTFVPRNVGQYDIPAIDFIYFNPSDGTYQTKTVPSLHMNIEKGNRSDADLERERTLRSSDIRDIKTGTVRFDSEAAFIWWGTSGYWAVVAGILLFFILLVAVLRRHNRANADVVARRRSKAVRQAKRRLRLAGRMLKKGDQKAFYTELSRALNAYLSDKLSVEVAALNDDRLIYEMNQRGVSEEQFSPFRQLLEECGFARFAPAADGNGANELYRRALDEITRLDNLLKTVDK